MATNKKPTTAAASTKPSNTRLRRPPNTSLVQNFHLVWLDESIDAENDDCRDSITKLRQVVNTVNTFIDVDECVDFITDTKVENTFMIISEALSRTIVPMAEDMPLVKSIYILRHNNTQNDKKAKGWLKVQGVYIDIIPICDALKKATRDCDHSTVSISFVKSTDEASNQNLDQLDQSFMYTQILKEILFTINFEQEHINEFLTYCREQFGGNNTELKNVDKIEKEYGDHRPIWWYTYGCFLYSMLNTALRLMEVDLIIRMGFFVRDLHNHIAELHTRQYSGQINSDAFAVYRGQGLSQIDFDQLMKTKGGLMSFNNFLSTSLDRAVSLAFADSNQYNPGVIGVLFEITISSSISSCPFANVGNVGHYQGEEEILFSMHSVFRIGKVKRIDGNNRLWQVNLTLTSDNDPQLHALTERIRGETFPTEKGWYRLGNLLVKLGQFDKAQQVFDIMLDQTTEQGEKAIIYHMLGMVKNQQGKYEEAITICEKALEIFQKTLPANHRDLATSYDNVGVVYDSMGEYSKTLLYFEKALEIRQKTLPENHLHLATSYHNIGMVYSNISEHSKALSYYAKALEIQHKTLPANHPVLASSYNNIGLVYNNMDEYSKALSYYEKALEIRQKTLSENHPDFAMSYNNIGIVYYSMGEYSKALSYYEKSLETKHKTLPANHPDLAQSHNNIGVVYDSMGEYSKALSYYEKALEISQKTLSTNHPHLAYSYNNIGAVYYKMYKYSKALPYYEKALEIRQKTLRENHPELAAAYNNIGMVYANMGEYSKALSYYEKALEIKQKTLPANHPDLAVSYNNIGEVYRNMSEYSKALSSHEKALKIWQKTLSANHPSLAVSYNNIGVVYVNMSEYSKALLYYEHALDIFRTALPSDHANIKSVRKSIEIVKKKL